MESMKQLIGSIALCWVLNAGCPESPLLISVPKLSHPQYLMWGRKKWASWITFHRDGGAGLIPAIHSSLRGGNWGWGGLSWPRSVPPGGGAGYWSSEIILLTLFSVCTLGLLFFFQWSARTFLLNSQTPTKVLSSPKVIKIDVLCGRWQLETLIPPSCWCHTSVKVWENFRNFMCKCFYHFFHYHCVSVYNPSTYVSHWRCRVIVMVQGGVWYCRVKLRLPFVSSLTLGRVFNLSENGENNIYLLHRVDVRVGWNNTCSVTGIRQALKIIDFLSSPSSQKLVKCVVIWVGTKMFTLYWLWKKSSY